MISFQSVKVRLTLWYAVILTIFLSIFSGLMVWELSRVLYRDADQTLLEEAKRIEEPLLPALTSLFEGYELTSDHEFIPSSLYYVPEIQLRLRQTMVQWEAEFKRVTKSTKMVRVIGLDHSILLANLKGWEEEIIFPDYERDSAFMEAGESFQTIHFRRRPIRLYYRLVRHRNVPLFLIQCGMSVHEVKSTLQRLVFIILVSIPGAVGVACLAGWFLAGGSFRPVDHMIRKARQISGHNIDERLPRTGTGDELDRLAETLNEMMTRIEISTRAIQDFSSDISHELKTPLAIIRGEIDLAMRRSRSPEDLKQTLSVIGEEVNELIRLVDDLLFLVKSDAKQLRFEKSRLSLTSLIRGVVERFQERARAKKLQLVTHWDANTYVDGDASYLKRVFNNLLDNAIKFTPEGGEIQVTLSQLDKKAVVCVKDTGVGIESEKQSKVFSRFYRTESARSQEGAGLGLNIVKAICDVHDAKITLESTLGQGTTVSVHFPLA